MYSLNKANNAIIYVCYKVSQGTRLFSLQC